MAKYQCADCGKLCKESEMIDEPLENEKGELKWVCKECFKKYPDAEKDNPSFEGTTTDGLGTFIPQNGGKIMHIPIKYNVSKHDPEED